MQKIIQIYLIENSEEIQEVTLEEAMHKETHTLKTDIKEEKMAILMEIHNQAEISKEIGTHHSIIETQALEVMDITEILILIRLMDQILLTASIDRVASKEMALEMIKDKAIIDNLISNQEKDHLAIIIPSKNVLLKRI